MFYRTKGQVPPRLQIVKNVFNADLKTSSLNVAYLETRFEKARRAWKHEKKEIRVTTGREKPDGTKVLENRKSIQLTYKEMREVGFSEEILKSRTERLDRSQTLLPACVIAYGGIGVEGEKFMQEEHIDFPIKYNTKDKLPDLLPFTIHLPLSLEGSKLYISHLKKEIFLEYGSMLVVRGDCKHAGCIYDTPSYRMFSYITTQQYKTNGKNIFLV